MADLFSAKDSSLGYFYQVIYGLYLLLRPSGKDNPVLSIETLDDIVLENSDGSYDLHQTKFHRKSDVSLSDRSTDFWKTIRVWSEQISNGTIDPENAIFCLVTTQALSGSSILEKLKDEDKSNEEIEEIESKLLDIARETSNEANKKGYLAFSKLSPENRKNLLRNLFIVDSAEHFDQLEFKTIKLIRTSTFPENVTQLYERLLGWWFQKCIHCLDEKISNISYDDVHFQIASIGETLQREKLPNDFPDPIEVDEQRLENVKERVYVKQLSIVQTGNHTIINAISNYERTFNQRSRWLREKLINPDEEEKYEKRLVDDWKGKFSVLKDDCETINDEATLQSKGKSFYTSFYANQTPQVFIRDNFKEFYFINGSCHILADSKKVGWHPNFKDKI